MPSKAVLEQKQALVADLSDRMKASVAGVIVNYTGISVADDTKLRKQLREAGVVYTVAKNTLIKRAAADAGVEIDDAVLNGTTAIATCETDYIAAAKILNDYAEGSKTGFAIKAGFIDGKAMNADEVKVLAKTPSKETLLTQLAFGLNATIQGLAIAIKAIADKQSEGAEEAPAAE
ncbi:MAG: 50S ribosomal protein L10 [Clostridia bacterium]|nr:50S ribosomal protein L10 [Clostridia bacterium]MBQ4397881.1 50S ribosomal protein L10 [Clostridia bacterium]